MSWKDSYTEEELEKLSASNGPRLFNDQMKQLEKTKVFGEAEKLNPESLKKFLERRRNKAREYVSINKI